MAVLAGSWPGRMRLRNMASNLEANTETNDEWPGWTEWAGWTSGFEFPCLRSILASGCESRFPDSMAVITRNI